MADILQFVNNCEEPLLYFLEQSMICVLIGKHLPSINSPLAKIVKSNELTEVHWAELRYSSWNEYTRNGT